VIDWLAVHFVCEGTALKLRADEKRMVVRRLEGKLLTKEESEGGYVPPGKLTLAQVADRMRTTDRSVSRFLAEMPAGTKRICPVCRELMWVVSGVVEPHPTSLFDECPMSGREVRRGLAATRPDLYAWLESA
jgi:hypothetical protein